MIKSQVPRHYPSFRYTVAAERGHFGETDEAVVSKENPPHALFAVHCDNIDREPIRRCAYDCRLIAGNGPRP
jgi:hypothetical protein